jgi:hypothetical protein
MNQLLFPGGGEREREEETNTEEIGAGNEDTGKVKEFSSLEDSFSVF